MHPSVGYATIVLVGLMMNEWYLVADNGNDRTYFGRFLYRIYGQETPECVLYGGGCFDVVGDTTLHTLAECPARALHKSLTLLATVRILVEHRSGLGTLPDS